MFDYETMGNGQKILIKKLIYNIIKQGDFFITLN